MPLYARSDLAAVTVSPAHGGCGNLHSRPVVEGVPVPVWEFPHQDCPGCAAYLAKHDHWSGTISEIPETPDEIKIREDREKRGAADQVRATASVLEKIGALPENLAAALMAFATGQQAPPPAAVACPDGHQNPAAAKFCGECGAAIGGAPEPASAAPAAPEPPAEVPAAEPDPLPDLDGLKLAELRQLARDRGLDSSGTKAEIAARLKGSA